MDTATLFKPKLEKKERQEEGRPRKRRIGALAALQDKQGTVITAVYWGYDVQRHDTETKTVGRKKITPYWNDMYEELFKKWGETQ